jgi:glycosyltransferase involved in cell wall biosynthesis
LNILHVISSIDPRHGGPPVALAGLGAAQAAAGLSVGVVATLKAGAQTELADRLRNQGVRVELVGPCWGPLAWHRKLQSIVAGAVDQADVVHIHGLWEEVQHQAARTAQRNNKPYVMRPCGMLDPWSLAQGRLKKALYLRWRLRGNLDRASALHFTTQTEADLARPLRMCPPALIEPNGIAPDEFTDLPPRGLFRRRFELPTDRLMVLFLSRLHHKKGLDLLLPAFARTADALLVLAGPDEEGYRAKLEAEVVRLGLGGRVFFPGMLRGEDKWAALADADLFVLPSYQENFGIAVVEALAAGLPVVISDQVNIQAEVSEAGVGGVTPTQVAPLAAELQRWLTDESLRRTAAQRAPGFARERYAWDRIAARWVEHYRRLAQSERGKK